MAKGNLFLGYGRGKVGDVVFSRQNGEQVTRARNRAPRNPQTPFQLLQRVIMKNSAQAFSLMQDICNHSFQGANGVTENQARFNVENVDKFRLLCADVINSGDPDEVLSSSYTNFLGKGASGCAINPYIVSDGKLPSIPIVWAADADVDTNAAPCVDVTLGALANITYAELISALGLERGDQLTSIVLTCDDSADGEPGVFNGFHVGRFILEPKDGDLTEKIVTTAQWNEKNENINLTTFGTNKLAILPLSTDQFYGNGSVRTAVAGCIIASRLVGSMWSRSRAVLNLRPCTVGTSWHCIYDYDVFALNDAVISYMADQNSALYLNQAENF